MISKATLAFKFIAWSLKFDAYLICYDVFMNTNPTIDAYDKYAQVYDEEVIDFWNNFPPEFLDSFVDKLSGKRVLNLGSGSGRDAVLLRDKGLEIVCVDASTSMVEITDHLGFESHHTTFEQLDFPDESFDGVWAYTSLIHVPPSDAKVVIEKIHAMLKLDGIFVMGAIEGETAGMVERDTMPGVSRYFKKYSRSELRALVESCGFRFMSEQDYQPHSSIYLNQLYQKK